LLIVFVWRNALGTSQLTGRAWLETFIAAVVGGPMTAVLLTPLIVDARPLYERTEASDVSRFQRILITRGKDATRLWLDGNHQLSSSDERSYHEALVRPAMSHRPSRVLILGGGDGLAAREVLLHDFVPKLTMVELDARVPALVRRSSLGALTGSVFDDPRLEVIEADAIAWLERGDSLFDAIIVDFPDPTTPLLAGLFAVETWKRVAMRLAPAGAIALQSSSIRYPRVVASIAKSVAAAGLQPLVYSREIESFGSNAFILVGGHALNLRAAAKTLDSDEELQALVQRVAIDESAPIVSWADNGSLETLAEAAGRWAS
jgi:spermidine synthase